MRVRVVRPGELGADEASRWLKYQQQSTVLCSPFLSLAFAQAVDQFTPRARVAVVEDSGEIVAFLPFDAGPLRVGRPIGYPMNDLQGFVSAGPPVDARQVIRAAGLRGWRFTAAPAEQTALSPFHYEDTAVGAAVIDVSGGYEAYRRALSRSVTTKPARKRRSLEREMGPVELVWDSASADHIRQMIAWKSGKYHGSRELFADPAAGRIVQRLTLADGAFGGIVSVLRAGQRPFAISCNLTGPAGIVGWFTAYDPELSSYSPGTMLTLAIAEEAAARGISRFDLGPGQDQYKFRLANQSYPVAGGAVWAYRAEAVARRLYRRVRG